MDNGTGFNQPKKQQRLLGIRKPRYLLVTLLALGIILSCSGLIYPALGNNSENASAKTIRIILLGLGVVLVLSAYLLAVRLARRHGKKDAAARPTSTGKAVPSIPTRQVTADPQIRGPKDVLAAIGGGIVLLLIGVWGVVEGPKYEVINGPDILIPIATLFNLGMGAYLLWKGAAGAVNLARQRSHPGISPHRVEAEKQPTAANELQEPLPLSFDTHWDESIQKKSFPEIDKPVPLETVRQQLSPVINHFEHNDSGQPVLPRISGTGQSVNPAVNFKLSIAGGAVGWLVGSVLWGGTLPLFSLPAILSIVIGSVVGGLIEVYLSGGKNSQ